MSQTSEGDTSEINYGHSVLTGHRSKLIDGSLRAETTFTHASVHHLSWFLVGILSTALVMNASYMALFVPIDSSLGMKPEPAAVYIPRVPSRYRERRVLNKTISVISHEYAGVRRWEFQADVDCSWVERRSAGLWGCCRTEYGSHLWTCLGLSHRCFMEAPALGSKETRLIKFDDKLSLAATYESGDPSPAILWALKCTGPLVTCCLCLTDFHAGFSKFPLDLLVSSFWWKTSKCGAQILAPSSTLTPWRTIFSLEVSICSLVLFEFLSVSLGLVMKVNDDELQNFTVAPMKWKLKAENSENPRNVLCHFKTTLVIYESKTYKGTWK